MTKISDLADSLDAQNAQQRQQQSKADQTAAAKQNTDAVVQAVKQSSQSTADGLKNVKGEVKVSNSDLAKTEDVTSAIDAINKLNITTFMSNPSYHDMATNMQALASEVQTLQQKFQQEGLTSLSSSFTSLVNKLAEISKQLNGTKVSVDDSFTKAMTGLKQSIDSIDFKPSVNVAAPDTKVITTPVDFKPVLSALAGVEQAVRDSETPETEQDLSPVTSGLAAVQKAITALRFPVPNYVLPFQDSNGKAAQAKLDANSNLLVNLGAERAQLTNLQTTITSSTAETTIINADATYKQDLYGLILTNTSGTTTKVTIKDSTGGTTRMVFEVPATDTRGFMLPTEAAHPQLNKNTSWTATCGTSVASLEVTALAVKNL